MWTRLYSQESCKMLHIKCQVNVEKVKWSQLYYMLHRDRLPSNDVYTGFQAGQIPWLPDNVECRVLDMRMWWCLTSFAVGEGTVDAMVWQIWHEPLVNLSRHCKTGSTSLGDLPQGVYQLGYRWHCVSSLSLMILHTSFLAFCCTSASAYIRNKMTINMALICMIFYMWRHT